MLYEYQVSFFDVDYARVLYFARFYDVVQRGADEWMHRHGLYYRELFAVHHLGTPISASFCRYLGPVHLEDVIQVNLGVKDPSPRGFTLVFDVCKQFEGNRVAWGYLERRFVDPDRRAREAPEHVVAAYRAMAEESRAFVMEVWQPLWERERRA